MEIIKRGTLPEDKVCYGTCSYCKSEMAALAKELTPGYTNPKDNELWYQGKCPVSGWDFNLYERGRSHE